MDTEVCFSSITLSIASSDWNDSESQGSSTISKRDRSGRRGEDARKGEEARGEARRDGAGEVAPEVDAHEDDEGDVVIPTWVSLYRGASKTFRGGASGM